MVSIARRVVLLLLLGGLPGAVAPCARAEVTVPAVFSNNAILQRDKPLSVWGWAAVGEKVAVTLGTRSGSAVTGADHQWKVVLDAQPVSKVPLVLTIAGTNTVKVANVLLGDVWLCSGQSNMTMPLGNYFPYPEIAREAAEADFPLIRQFGVEKVSADSPQDNVKGDWLVCDKRTAGRFSAVGFYFARKLHAETGVPIGILRSAAGSTVIECWLSQETFFTTPALAPIAAKMRESLASWQQEKAAALKAGKSPEAADFPPFPFGEKVRRPRAVSLYNGMIAPLAPFSLRGIVWYQGESNALSLHEAKLYADEQRALIQSWRRLFNDDALPFLFVQLPNYRPVNDSPGAEELWSFLRESQRESLNVPHTGMAVAIDVGDGENIHPHDKFDVGERLALLALAGSDGNSKPVCNGPLFRAAKVGGAQIRVSFDHVGAGLMAGDKPARGPAVEKKGATLQRFAIAGSDRKWVWANAVIDGDTVVVSSPEISHPVAVRYAFSSNPHGCNLYNREGLPASPFRSDDW